MVDLKVSGSVNVPVMGTTKPFVYQIATYSASEEATPIDGGDTTGGTGQITLSAQADEGRDGSELLLNKTVEIVDQSNGRTTGTVNAVVLSAGMVSITADSMLALLNAEKQVQPFSGTLQDAIYYYLGLAEIATAKISVHASIASRAVVFPGWYGSVWDGLKQLCWTEQIEISLVSSIAVVRPLRTRTLTTENDASVNKSIANGQLARTVEVYNYNSQYVTNELVYPAGGWHPDVQVYQVDANETLEVDVPLDASVLSVSQPTVEDSVAADYDTTSVYSVSGNDGLPITAAQWTATGGSLTVSINEDTRSLHLVIKGSSIEKYAPYRIAASSGSGTYYSTLRIIGTGVVWNKELITLPTGVPDAKTAVDVGITIDSPFVDSLVKAYDVGMRAAARYASAAQTLEVSASVVNRRGDVGNINLPAFSVFNTDNAGKTFAQFDVTWSGLTFADLTNFYYAKVADSFDNQAFGNVAGARVKNGPAYYRVRSANVSEGGISYSAERDTTFSDFNTALTGKTFAQFNTLWAAPGSTVRKFEEFAIQPLRN